ncbi:hypothetical protein YERSI8AC_10060 [Enterobacterales bacterium 8AC]|nr:hypothetical protein YERSI8AC_10060 [Enterobacterales bacterium 8AC]
MTTIFGGHTSTETVATVALQYGRLESAFHSDFYLNLNELLRSQMRLATRREDYRHLNRI